MICFPLASNFYALQCLQFVYLFNYNTPLYIYIADLFKLSSDVSWILHAAFSLLYVLESSFCVFVG